MVILEVKNLATHFFDGSGKVVKAVDWISFRLEENEILGVAGESGSGKSVTARSILRLIKDPGKIISGSIIFEEENLLRIPEEKMRKIRGAKIALISQNPIKSWNPVVSVGAQMVEMFLHHRKNEKNGKEFVLELLKKVGISDPEKKFHSIPQEWSGGMLQRAMIARMAFISSPKIIIADEPTTALDVTVGSQILDLLISTVKSRKISLILITHDLGVLAEYAARVIVMEKGKIVEENSVLDLFENPTHPYTRELIEAAKTNVFGEKSNVSNRNILEVKDLKVYFPVFGGKVFRKKIGDIKAVDGVSFQIKKGEILGLAGESGCGKTTLARAILGLLPKTYGKIIFRGKDLDSFPPEDCKEIRKAIQIVFQDPYNALDHKMTVESIIREGIDIRASHAGKLEKRDMIIELAKDAGLAVSLLFRYPKELSDGERQRVAIARALSTAPELLVLDEPISSLDKRIQKQILELLLLFKNGKNEQNLTYLFISHDLNVISKICDKIAVMYLGKIIEIGTTEEIKNNPLHPYTQALFSSQSVLDPKIARSRKKIILQGETPSFDNIPSGCRFHTRCSFLQDRCKKEEPSLAQITESHKIACFIN